MGVTDLALQKPNARGNPVRIIFVKGVRRKEIVDGMTRAIY